MTTDETARAILDGIQTQHSRWISPTSGAVAVEIPAEHLQAMAKLWLMRDEIIDTLNNADDRTMVDFRVDNQINSVPIAEIRALPSSIAVTMMQIMDDAGSDHIALKRLDKYAQELKGAIYDDIRSESRPLSESGRGVAVEQSRHC